MVLVEGSKGTLTMTGSVQDIIPTVSVLAYYSGYLFLHNMTAGDVIEFTIYVNDPHIGTQRIYDQFIVSGVQNKPATFVVNVPTDSFKVTAEQTGGTNRAITFVRYDS